MTCPADKNPFAGSKKTRVSYTFNYGRGNNGTAVYKAGQDVPRERAIRLDRISSAATDSGRNTSNMVLLADRHTPLGNEYGQQNGHDGHAGERNVLFVGLHVKKLQAPTFFNPSANPLLRASFDWYLD